MVDEGTAKYMLSIFKQLQEAFVTLVDAPQNSFSVLT